MINSLIKKYKSLLNLGVTEDLSFSEKLRTESNNLVSLIFIISLIAYLFYNAIGPRFPMAYYISSSWVFIFICPLILNGFKKYTAARLITILFPLVGLVLVHLLHGWNVRIESSYLLLSIFSVFFFNKKSAIVMCVFIAITYIISAITLSIIPPPLKGSIVAPAPFLYFGLSLMAGLVITFRVLTENAKYSDLSVSQELLLKEKNEELEMFSRIASHDLKGPVRNVLNFSNLMEKNLENQNYAELQKNLDFVLANSLQMSELIEDMKDFSSIDNLSKTNQEEVCLTAMVRKVELLLKTEIEEVNGKIKCDELLAYKCNPSDMLLVFQNIIQNGLKYNRSETPTLEISCKKNEESFYIYFKDNGIGIKEEYFSHIFSLFKRLHSRNEFGGTGLGLSLSKKILQKYKAEISVESVLNEGSTFIIRLPL